MALTLIAGQVAGISRMRNSYRSRLLIRTAATQKELARHVAYLKAENSNLRRRLPARVLVELTERRLLVRLGAKLGRALEELVTIVHPGTLRGWIREDSKATKRPRGKVGRRWTGEQIRKLTLKFAKANNWGYTCILGELRKLNIRARTGNPFGIPDNSRASLGSVGLPYAANSADPSGGEKQQPVDFNQISRL